MREQQSESSGQLLHADLGRAIVVREALPGSTQRAASLHPVLQMQRRYGNRYVQRMVAVARQSDGSGAGEVTPDVESAIERARGGGQSLDSRTRSQMESAFGADFSGVRIHTGAESHTLNRSVNAIAFTTGRDIFFRDGAYNPGESGGRELLAHELTHVVQQGAAQQVSGQAQRVAIQRTCPECEEEKKNHVQTKLVVGEANDQYEQEADRIAKTVMSTLNATAAGAAETVSAQAWAKIGAQAPTIQREFNPFPKETLEKSLAGAEEYLSEKEVEQRLLAFLLRARAFLHPQQKNTRKNSIAIENLTMAGQGLSPQEHTRIPQGICNKITELLGKSSQDLAPDPYVQALNRCQAPSDDPEIVARRLAKLLPKVHAGSLEFLEKEMQSPRLTLTEKTKRAIRETDIPASLYEPPSKTSRGQLTDEELFKKVTGKDIAPKVLPVGRIAQVVKGVVDQSSEPKAPPHRECSVPKSADGELDWIAFEEDLQLLPAAEKVRLEQAKTAYEIADPDSERKEKWVPFVKHLARNFVSEERVAKLLSEKKHKKDEKTGVEGKIYGKHGKYDNSLEVAYRLTDLLQRACEKNESSVKLVLKDAYNQVPQEEMPPILKALQTILGHIKRLLPKTTKGMAVQVFFGKNLVETIDLNSVLAGQSRPLSPEELTQQEQEEKEAAEKTELGY